MATASQDPAHPYAHLIPVVEAELAWGNALDGLFELTRPNPTYAFDDWRISLRGPLHERRLRATFELPASWEVSARFAASNVAYAEPGFTVVHTAGSVWPANQPDDLGADGSVPAWLAPDGSAEAARGTVVPEAARGAVVPEAARGAVAPAPFPDAPGGEDAVPDRWQPLVVQARRAARALGAGEIAVTFFTRPVDSLAVRVLWDPTGLGTAMVHALVRRVGAPLPVRVTGSARG